MKKREFRKLCRDLRNHKCPTISLKAILEDSALTLCERIDQLEKLQEIIKHNRPIYTIQEKACLKVTIVEQTIKEISKYSQIDEPDYIAPKPKRTKKAWLKKIGLRLIFPPILLWDLAKFGMNALLGKWVGSIVLPALELHWWKKLLPLQKELLARRKKEGLDYKTFWIKTHDNAALETCEITYCDVPRAQQEYIIYLGGNDAYCRDYLDEMETVALNLKCTVIGFNLRGVSFSKRMPQSKDDLITDGIAQVQWLLSRGFLPKRSF